MSLYNNKRFETDDEPDFDFINTDYGFDDFDTDDDFNNPISFSQTETSSKKKKHKEQKPATIWSEIFSYIKILAAAVIIAFVFTQYIIVNAEVPTGSMKNTIMEHDRLIGFRLAYVFDEPKRGDVVIFKFPDNEEQNYVKRIIGIPGDVIQIKNGQVYVNGEVLTENYLKESMIESDSEEIYVVPEGHYFMMGDNRNSSLDSRYWKNTYVAKDKILAKVIFRYYDGYNTKIDFSLIH